MPCWTSAAAPEAWLWVPWTPLLTVLRWLGKAPAVQVFSAQTLVEEMRTAGFVDVGQPPVGAKPTTVFVVATRP